MLQRDRLNSKAIALGVLKRPTDKRSQSSHPCRSQPIGCDSSQWYRYTSCRDKWPRPTSRRMKARVIIFAIVVIVVVVCWSCAFFQRLIIVCLLFVVSVIVVVVSNASRQSLCIKCDAICPPFTNGGPPLAMFYDRRAINDATLHPDIANPSQPKIHSVNHFTKLFQ